MKKAIFLIEDNPDDVELTKLAFEENNIANEIIVAADGAEAIDMLDRLGGSGSDGLPAVILLDLKLPKVDGIEVLRKIRGSERTKLIPVVVLTSSDEERDLVESYRLGANSYIRKPVDFAEFLAAVRQLGFYWLLLNQTPGVLGRS